ncbi:glycosyltransferase [Marinobacterium rhizophilum]|uniref:Glycosyltransferase n=1 Tax=Marinobacterium rhizophilum TaxID=420402 RepID=A0ABY5HFF9_9GAMM|nr:glycosyltransferase [Marinobacterium rhizophilum]UTW10586.1 glycosyltransferase [Marinobacterium rhizophilum]
MRICEVLGGNEEGGLEKHFVELCNGLSEQHDVIAIAHEKYRSRFAAAVRFEALDLARSRRNPRALWQLVRRINAVAPDVVHCHAHKAAAMVGTIRRWIRCPLVATAHGFKRDNSAFSGFDRVIAVSRGIAEHLATFPVTVVYNGIHWPPVAGMQLVEPSPFQTGQSSQRVQVLTVGRLVPEKGFDILLDAWQGLDADLLIVGEGPQRGALEARLVELGLQDRTRLLGHRDDVPALIAAADLVVISSRRESFSYVMAETLLSRTPLISTRVAGPREFLPSAGLCEGDAAALHHLLTQTLADLPAYARLLEPVWARALEALHFDAMLSHTGQVLQQTVKARKTHGQA